MNRTILARDYGIPPQEPVAEDDVLYYLAALYLLAREGSVTIEEEMFVETWVAYLEVPPELARRAFALARAPGCHVSAVAARIQVEGLRQSLIRDGLRVALLDGPLNSFEHRVLRGFSEALGLSEEEVARIAREVERESQLLAMFTKMVEQDNAVHPVSGYLALSIDRLRYEQSRLLPTPQTLPEEEIEAGLALLLRFKGLCASSREARIYIQSVVESLQIASAGWERAQAWAWDISLSSRDLLEKIRNRTLQLVFLRDVFQLASLDGEIHAQEQRVIDQICAVLPLSEEETAQALDTCSEEAAVRRNLKRLTEAAAESASPPVHGK